MKQNYHIYGIHYLKINGIDTINIVTTQAYNIIYIRERQIKGANS